MSLFKEKKYLFLHQIAGSHPCLLFQEFCTITKGKKTNKTNLCLFPIFPFMHSYSSPRFHSQIWKAFVAPSSSSITHGTTFFRLDFAHSSIKTLAQRLPVTFSVFHSRGRFVLFIPLTFRRCVEALSPRLGVQDALRCTSPPPSLSLPQQSPSQLPRLHPTAEVQSPLDSFRLGLSSLSPCVLSPSNLILYQDFNDHLKANDSKSRPLVQISELQNYRQSFLWDPPLLDML